jgi:hypothetical protein
MKQVSDNYLIAKELLLHGAVVSLSALLFIGGSPAKPMPENTQVLISNDGEMFTNFCGPSLTSGGFRLVSYKNARALGATPAAECVSLGAFDDQPPRFFAADLIEWLGARTPTQKWNSDGTWVQDCLPPPTPYTLPCTTVW